MSQLYSVTIDSGISAPVPVQDVADGINALDKHNSYPLMSNIQLAG